MIQFSTKNSKVLQVIRTSIGISSLIAVQQVSAVGLILNPTSTLTGIANAGSTVYDHSVAAISNNPAAMSLMNRKQVGGNLSLVIPDWSIDEKWDCNSEGNCAKSNVGHVTPIPTIGLIRPMDNDFTWGIGMGAIAGAGLEYGDSWGGRGIITENTLQVAELINSISWRANEQWTFGVGLGIIYGSFSQNQDLPTIGATDLQNVGSLVSLAGDLKNCSSLGPALKPGCINDAIDDSDFDATQLAATIDNLTDYSNGASGTEIELEGNDVGAKISLGATYEFTPGHRLGINYQYLSDFTFEGHAKIDGQLLSDEMYQNQHMSLTWAMPERLVVSGSHSVTDDLNLFWDIEKVFYHTFESTDLRIDGYPELELGRNFKDANRYAVGGEYSLDERLTLQMGLSYDESPVDDSDRMPDIPVDDIIKTTFGAIYQVNEKLNVHGYLAVEFLGDANIEQLATIDGHKVDDSFQVSNDTTIYVVGVSFGYFF